MGIDSEECDIEAVGLVGRFNVQQYMRNRPLGGVKEFDLILNNGFRKCIPSFEYALHECTAESRSKMSTFLPPSTSCIAALPK